MDHDHAAIIIQSAWRSYRFRKQLLERGQRSSHATVQETLRLYVDSKKAKEPKSQHLQAHRFAKLLHHIQTDRHNKETNLRLLSSFPRVHSRRQNETILGDAAAATKIQAAWREYHSHKQAPTRRSDKVQRERAAKVIQGQVRQWLERQWLKNITQRWWQQRPPLTAERVASLQSQIEKWQQTHSVQYFTRELQENLHTLAQDKLGRYYTNRAQLYRQERRQCALLAQLESVVILLDQYSSLELVTPQVLDTFQSMSPSVIDVAQQQHQLALKRYSCPWWEKLVHDDDL